uniref:Heterochromatin protein 1-binding protein 3-like protein n=1 Tax=Callorhinchus milii TaxID=7868 RepID=V9KCV1_CALMI
MHDRMQSLSLQKDSETEVAEMPIRRNASPSAQESPTKNKPAADADVTSEESVSAEEEPENDATAVTQEEEKKEAEKSGDEEKEETKPSEEPKKEEKEPTKDKKIKKTIPSWATLSASQLARVQKNSQMTATARPKMDAIVVEAIKSCFQKAGVSVVAIRKYIINKYPSLELERRGYILKQALKRELQRGSIKQVKGKGASGSFLVSNGGKQAQKSKQERRKTASPGTMDQPIKLEDALPMAFTKLCEPKEASYSLIKKYLLQYYPKLNAESRPHLLKQALQRAVDKGQLEQITGKGASGTFQLKKVGDKPLLSGGPFEDAILSAIVAMNEPKTCSTTALKKYISEKLPAANSNFQMHLLKRTLQKCEKNGWIEQISGKGFSGSFQLCFPFYPSPNVLFPEKEQEKEEESEEEEEEEEKSEQRNEWQQEAEPEPEPEPEAEPEPEPEVEVEPVREVEKVETVEDKPEISYKKTSQVWNEEVVQYTEEKVSKQGPENGEALHEEIQHKHKKMERNLRECSRSDSKATHELEETEAARLEAEQKLEELRRRQGEKENEEFEKMRIKQQEAAVELEELKKKREGRKKVREEEEQKRLQEESEKKAREEEEKRKLKEDIEKRRAEAAEKRYKPEELEAADDKEPFKCVTPRGSSLKIGERAEFLNKSAKKSTSIKTTRPLLGVSKIDSKLEQYTSAIQGAKAAKGGKSSASDLPLTADGVRNIKSMWETGDVYGSPSNKGTPNKEVAGLKVGVAGRINQWLNKTPETNKSPASKASDVKPGDVSSKRNLWENKTDSPNEKSATPSKITAGSKFKSGSAENQRGYSNAGMAHYENEP